MGSQSQTQLSTHEHMCVFTYIYTHIIHFANIYILAADTNTPL